MKILIAGGAGFIGNNLSRRLSDLGHDVVILDTLTDYGMVPFEEYSVIRKERLKDIAALPMHKLDIADLSGAWPISEFEVVVNLAAFSRVKLVHQNPVLASDSMVKGIFNLLHATGGCKRFVQVSSSMVYGNFTNEAGHQMQSVTEEFPCNPVNYYGILKLAGEGIVKQYCAEHDTEYTIVRPSAVYGPKDAFDRVVPKFIMNAMQGLDTVVNGDSQVDFTYIEDFIDGMIECCINPFAANETFNITKGHSRSLPDAQEIIQGITGSTAPVYINFEQDALFPKRGTCNINKAKSMLGFNPRTTIEQGFPLTHDWLKTIL